MTLHYANNQVFYAVFDEVVQLIGEATQYLEGEGRDKSFGLPRSIFAIYTSESIKLSNKILAMSNWLLAHRAYFRGEIQSLIGVRLKQIMDIADIDDVIYNALPIEFLMLMEKSDRLFDRLKRLDDQINTPAKRTPCIVGKPKLYAVR